MAVSEGQPPAARRPPPPRRPPARRVPVARVTHAFAPQHEGQLGVSVGDEVEVVEATNDHWVLVRRADGATGHIPTGYLGPCQLREQPQPRRRQGQGQGPPQRGRAPVPPARPPAGALRRLGSAAAHALPPAAASAAELVRNNSPELVARVGQQHQRQGAAAPQTAAPAPAPQTTEQERWLAGAHATHMAQEQGAAQEIRRRMLCPVIWCIALKSIPSTIVFGCLFLMAVSDIGLRSSATCWSFGNATLAANSSAAAAELWAPLAGECAVGDMLCVQIMEAEVAEEWSELLHGMHVGPHSSRLAAGSSQSCFGRRCLGGWSWS